MCMHVHMNTVTYCVHVRKQFYIYDLILFSYYSVFMFPTPLLPCTCHMTIKKEILQHYSVGDIIIITIALFNISFKLLTVNCYIASYTQWILLFSLHNIIGMCFEVAGTLLGISVYTVFYTSLVHNKDDSCSNGERQPDQDMRATFRYHALTLGVLTFFFILTTFIGVREQQGQ